MFYLLIEATPDPRNPEALEVGGAYVNCWVNADTEQGARTLAEHHIREEGWTPLRVDETDTVTAETYRDNPEGLSDYRRAESEGSALVFNCWVIDAEDADDPPGAD